MDSALIMQPRKQKFMQVIIFYIRVFGMWPNKHAELRDPGITKYHGKVLLYLFPMVCISELIYIKNHGHANFFEKGHMYVTMGITWLLQARIYLPETWKYCNLIKQFFDEIHLSNYQYHDEYSMEVLLKYEKITFWMSAFLILNAHIGFSLFNVIPAYNNWASGNFNKPTKELQNVIYLTLPWDNEFSFEGWCAAAVLIFYISAAATFVVVVSDIFMFCIIIHLAGQINVLKHNFEVLNEMIKEHDLKLDDERDDKIYELLKRYIKHHRLVLQVLGDLTEVYGPALLVNYAYESVSCCVLLLELSEGTTEAYIRYGPLSVVIFGQLIGTSAVFELLAGAIDEFRDVVYCTPWPVMSLRNQRLVCTILLVSQVKYKCKACKFVDVNLATMQGILKSSFSYFALLKTLGADSSNGAGGGAEADN